MADSQVKGRVAVLDVLRFVAAMWVVFSHCGAFPLTYGIDRSRPAGLITSGLYGNMFAGVPAVIVFFVISGFCIHYPYRATRPALMRFLVRRYVRIVIPVIAAVALARPFHVKLSLFSNSVLWSLTAEIIYYTIYPALWRVKACTGWVPLIVGSYIVGYGVVLTEPRAADYTPFGVWLDWVVALPCWLLGCVLAESKWITKSRASSVRRVWCWRLLVWLASWVCSALRFHSPIGYPWTMNIFAVLVCVWISVEISVAKAGSGGGIWSWCGRWSYSIYLVHMIAYSCFSWLDLSGLGVNLVWCLQTAFILLCSYVFFLVVEQPSHRLAKLLTSEYRCSSDVSPPSESRNDGAAVSGAFASA